MSDYVKKKVIRLPFPKSLIEKLGVDDCWECEEYLREKFGNDMWDNFRQGKDYFSIECTDKNDYLDYIVGKYYEDGEYGFAWYLNEEDIKKYKPLFDKGEFEYDVKDLRKVCYCYYNGTDAPDYYEPTEITFENIQQ